MTKVLAIDDDSMVREMVVRFLQIEGYDLKVTTLLRRRTGRPVAPLRFPKSQTSFCWI